MKIKSSKSKGRRLQNTVRDALNSCGYHTKAAIMGESGVDVSGYDCEWGVECKNTETINIWAALEQAEFNAKARNLTPVLAFKRNRTQEYVVLSLTDFITLIRTRNELMTQLHGPQQLGSA